MKNLYILAGLSLVTITGSTTAYLSPQEVFTDLEIPEMEDTLPLISDPLPAAEAPKGLDSFGSDEVIEPEENTEEENGSGIPMFFRSGKTLDQNAIEEPATKPLEVFDLEEVEEPEVVEPEDEEELPEVVEEELPEINEEEVLEEEVAEVVQPAAEGSLFMKLLKNSKYYIAGAAVLLGVFLFFILRKKKPSAAGMPGNIPAQTIIKPEESSPRLEQALKAMEKEGIHAAGERLKEVSDDTVSFTEPPSTNPEQ